MDFTMLWLSASRSSNVLSNVILPGPAPAPGQQRARRARAGPVLRESAPSSLRMVVCASCTTAYLPATGSQHTS